MKQMISGSLMPFISIFQISWKISPFKGDLNIFGGGGGG